MSKVAAETAAQAQKVMTDGAAQARIAMEKNMEKKTKRDADRHKNNPRLQ